MQTADLFLLTILMIFALPYFLWRFGGIRDFVPLVVVEIIAGIILGPGVLGSVFPNYYNFLFRVPVVNALNGVASWAVIMFVWGAGVELDLRQSWRHRGETIIAALFALGTPLFFGSIAALLLLIFGHGWIGSNASPWQFLLGIGMACAVTALPILAVFLEELQVLNSLWGQRILRYASLDDLAIWGVLALILMDWKRVKMQLAFIAGFAVASIIMKQLIPRLSIQDRWYISLIWLAACSFAADASGFHFMVGAYLSGTVLDASWFEEERLNSFRKMILLAVMPVFFLSTGLKTRWQIHGSSLLGATLLLLLVSVAGKLVGTGIAGRILGWTRGQSHLIAWLLQTKALIMIIFSDVLLSGKIITDQTFTALLLMAAASTMLTMPVITRSRLKRCIESPSHTINIAP